MYISQVHFERTALSFDSQRKVAKVVKPNFISSINLFYVIFISFVYCIAKLFQFYINVLDVCQGHIRHQSLLNDLWIFAASSATIWKFLGIINPVFYHSKCVFLSFDFCVWLLLTEFLKCLLQIYLWITSSC